jgi:ribosomal RNA-processing protein 9
MFVESRRLAIQAHRPHRYIHVGLNDLRRVGVVVSSGGLTASSKHGTPVEKLRPSKRSRKKLLSEHHAARPFSQDPATMSSFFTTPASQRKRKRTEAPSASSKRRTISNYQGGSKAERAERQEKEDSISASESEESDIDGHNGREADLDLDDSDSSGDEGETQDERRLRLAQRYLENIRGEITDLDPNAFDAAEIDKDLIADRLKEDAAETKGKLHRKIGAGLDFAAAEHSFFESNQNAVTAVAVCHPYAYTVAKDTSVTKWELSEPGQTATATNISSRKKPKFLKKFITRNRGKESFVGHLSAILCIAVSASGRFLATGGADKRLVIWDAASLTPLKVFHQHRDAVLSVSFRRGTHSLFSASADRTIKIWSLDEMAYIETLFGHQDHVVDVAGMAQERCVSVGARDRTARLWKVVEESQLVFRGGGATATRTNKNDQSSGAAVKGYAEGSIDRVAAIDEDMFVTGSDNGSISLWSVHRKKPVHTVYLAHGLDPQLRPEEASAEEKPDMDVPGRPMPRWITALATIPLADLVLSGSWDGYVRAWRVSDDRRRLERCGIVGQIDDEEIEAGDTQPAESREQIAKGVINDISVLERGDKGKGGICVVAAVGKEHRLAKWKKHKGKNGAVVFEVVKKALLLNGEGLNGNGHVEE